MSCSFSGSDIFQNGLGQPLLKPFILWIALASDSFESKVFPIGFLGLLSDVVSLWDKSVAIRVQIEVLYPAGSTECFLGVVFSVVWRYCLLVSGGRRRSRSLQLHLREGWDFTDEGAMVSWPL